MLQGPPISVFCKIVGAIGVGDEYMRIISVMYVAWGNRYVALIFFFSSRRRHTRLQGDWSSDVCSSDLAELVRIVRSPGVFPVPDVPIIMLTGHVERWRVIEASRLGVNEFLKKPVSGKDRKSTRLNSSHLVISYAVFCLKKKKTSTTVLTSFQRTSAYGSYTHPCAP